MQEGILCDVHLPISPAADGSIYRQLLGQAQTLTCTPARVLKFSYLVGRRASNVAPICFKRFNLFSAPTSTFCAKITAFSLNQSRSFCVYRIFSCFCLLWFLISSGQKPLAKPRSLPSVTVATIVTVEQVLLFSYLRH